MPIVINRNTGEVKAPEYSQAQRDLAWEAVVRAWAEANKPTLQALADEHASEPRGV